MRELSLHIMDIAENGVSAGARLVSIEVWEDRKNNLLRITVSDDGRGMPEEMVKAATDPFFTTRTTRRVGLGLSLFREASKRCEGEFQIRSREGEGTVVSASFRRDHIDLAPLGDLAGSVTALIMGNPDVDFVYVHKVDHRSFRLDTREVREALDGEAVNHPEVLKHLAGLVREALDGLYAP